MAKPLEKKSAKVLAFFLALIMIGSALAIAFRGSYFTPKRNVKVELSDLDALTKLPDTPNEVYYLNFKVNDSNLFALVNAYAKVVLKDPIFRYVRIPTIDSVIFAYYYNTTSYIYLFNTTSKVYATYDEKENVSGFNVKIKRPYYAFCDEINPAVVGTSDIVYDFLSNVSSENESLFSEIPKENYAFIRAFQGDIVKQLIKLNNSNESVADFYFEGYALNGSKYEKVVAINFTSNTFFVKSNVTEEYYVIQKGSLNIAVMLDTNFTKLLNAQPEMRSVIVRVG